MSTFDNFCNKLCALSVEEKTDIINDYTKTIIPALEEITEDGENGLALYINFLLCAVAADGKLAKEEYELLKPIFDAIAGKETTYDDAIAMFKESGLDKPENHKKTADLMVDLIGEVSAELKYAIITVCLLVCAIDGEISKEEKEWILNLADDNFGTTPMDIVEQILDEAKVFTLATIDGDKPRMRVLGFKCNLDGVLFFGIGTFKEVFAQLVSNPKCEILASVGPKFLRWNGKAAFCEDERLVQEFEKALPQIAAVYKENGLQMAFFTIEDGSAEIVSVDNSKQRLF